MSDEVQHGIDRIADCRRRLEAAVAEATAAKCAVEDMRLTVDAMRNSAAVGDTYAEVLADSFAAGDSPVDCPPPDLLHEDIEEEARQIVFDRFADAQLRAFHARKAIDTAAVEVIRAQLFEAAIRAPCDSERHRLFRTFYRLYVDPVNDGGPELIRRLRDPDCQISDELAGDLRRKAWGWFMKLRNDPWASLEL